MKAEVAQLVALVCHGNAFLGGANIPDFFPSNSTCKFCDRITFIEFAKKFLGGVQEKEVASNPNDWFKKLHTYQVHGLRLSQSPRNEPGISDRNSAGFVGGGGIWTIEAIKKDNLSEIWRARWEVWNRDAPDRRIWRVTYGKLNETRTLTSAAKSLEELKIGLKDSLQEIHNFSEKNKCGDFFTKHFADALESISSTARHGYHKDLSFDGILSPEAATLLDACQTAWVFGAMGSWNDMGFDGEKGREYDRVSDNLFRLLSEIIPAATNDSFRLG